MAKNRYRNASIIATLILVTGCGSVHAGSNRTATQPPTPVQATATNTITPPMPVQPTATSAISLNNSCALSTLGWTMTFTNLNSYDITVERYTVVFFDSSQDETGSEESINTPFVVAANNTFNDVENHSISAPVPDNSVTCRLSSWIGEDNG